jgi:DNA invertase Pin-like site-specific DNA recombinase
MKKEMTNVIENQSAQSSARIKAAIYTRVASSRLSQQGETSATAKQIAACEEYCHAKGYEVILYIGIHGIADPGLLLLRKTMQMIDVFIATDYARFARDSELLLSFLDTCSQASIAVEVLNDSDSVVNPTYPHFMHSKLSQASMNLHQQALEAGESERPKLASAT